MQHLYLVKTWAFTRTAAKHSLPPAWRDLAGGTESADAQKVPNAKGSRTRPQPTK